MSDELPFIYQPVPIKAITPEIERACKADIVIETISFADKDGNVDSEVEHML